MRAYHGIVVRHLLWIGIVGCSPLGRGELDIERVEPAMGTATQATAVRIVGSGFHLPITSDVDDGRTVVHDMAISVGDVPLVDAAWRGLERIDGTVPAGLPVGPHDVRIRIGDREGVLPGGYVVTSEAGPDGGSQATTNVVATSNGGVLESFTSEYCAPVNPPANCEQGYWDHTNVNDGAYAMGNGPVPFSASWASGRKLDASPEEFVFSFAGGASATIERVVIQNYGEEGGFGPYYATRFSLYGESPSGGGDMLLLDRPLVADESVQSFELTPPILVRRLRLSITDSVANDYWEIGEFEAWGRLQ